jgi:hypothetical protein
MATRYSKAGVLYYFPLAHLKPTGSSRSMSDEKLRLLVYEGKKKITKRTRREIEKGLKRTSWGLTRF